MSLNEKTSNTKSLREAIGSLFKNKGLQEGIDKVEIDKAWPQLMGSMISTHTRSLHLQDGKLTITLDSAPLRHELSYSKEKIKDLLNEHLAKQVIKEVDLR